MVGLRVEPSMQKACAPHYLLCKCFDRGFTLNAMPLCTYNSYASLIMNHSLRTNNFPSCIQRDFSGWVLKKCLAQVVPRYFYIEN